MANGSRKVAVFRLGVLAILAVLIFLTSIPTHGYRGTVWPTYEDDESGAEFAAANELPERCQRMAREVATGERVTERGYQLSPVADSQVLTTTIATGGWEFADEFCVKRLTEGSAIRVNGTYYAYSYSIKRGRMVDPLWLHKARFTFVFMGMLYGGYLILGEISRYG